MMRALTVIWTNTNLYQQNAGFECTSRKLTASHYGKNSCCLQRSEQENGVHIKPLEDHQIKTTLTKGSWFGCFSLIAVFGPDQKNRIKGGNCTRARQNWTEPHSYSRCD